MDRHFSPPLSLFTILLPGNAAAPRLHAAYPCEVQLPWFRNAPVHKVEDRLPGAGFARLPLGLHASMTDRGKGGCWRTCAVHGLVYVHMLGYHFQTRFMLQDAPTPTSIIQDTCVHCMHGNPM